MKLSIIKDTPNKHLHRHELELHASDSKTTPSRKELVERIAQEANSKPELVAIQKIEQQFGTQTNRVWARIYENRADLEKTELKYVVGRDKGEKKKPGKKKKEAPKK